MGSSLAPRNVIMTELEKKIVKPMIESRRLKFYVRQVHDTLLLAKEGDINYIFGKFNSVRKYLKFTIYRFDDNDNVYFLDIAIDKLTLICTMSPLTQDNILGLLVVFYGIIKPHG